MEQMPAIKSLESSSLAGTTGRRKPFSDYLHSSFPFYLNDDRKNFLLTVVCGAFVTLFLYLFKTESDLEFSSGFEWLHGLITFAVLVFNILFLPRMFPALMDPVSWTVKKYIVLTIGHLFLIWAISTLIDKVFICPLISWASVASHVSEQVTIKGIIPIALTTLFLRAHQLQQNLHEAIKTNHELEKIKTLKNESAKVGNPITLFSNTSESLTFNLPDLLFIEADDNYSTVVWKEAGTLQKKLLRVNLKNLESQLDNSFTLRCHRSYIINVNAISAISGNLNGYKLKINSSDFSIPVSRPKGKEVMEKISQLRNMMELS